MSYDMKSKISMAGPGDERDGNRDSDQYDNDPFQKLHATSPGSIGHFSVNAFKRFEFPQNAGVPIFQVKTLGDKAIYTSEVLITEKFQGIGHPFEQQGTIDLKLRDVCRMFVIGTWEGQ